MGRGTAAKPKPAVKEHHDHTPYTDILLVYDVIRRNIINRWLTALVILLFALWYPTVNDNVKRLNHICTSSLQPWLITDYGCEDPTKCDINHAMLTSTSRSQMMSWYDVCENRSRHYHERLAHWYNRRFATKDIPTSQKIEIEAAELEKCVTELKTESTAEMTEEALKRIESECRNRLNDSTPES